MPFLTSLIFSKFDQPLVNSSKSAEVPKPSPAPVHGISNTKMSPVGVAPQAASGGAQTTTSRANFAEAFPELVAKQQYHMSQLKKHIPVHRSGRLDNILLPGMYALSGICLCYTMYLYGQIIKKS